MGYLFRKTLKLRVWMSVLQTAHLLIRPSPIFSNINGNPCWDGASSESIENQHTSAPKNRLNSSSTQKTNCTWKILLSRLISPADDDDYVDNFLSFNHLRFLLFHALSSARSMKHPLSTFNQFYPEWTFLPRPMSHLNLFLEFSLPGSFRSVLLSFSLTSPSKSCP